MHCARIDLRFRTGICLCHRLIISNIDTYIRRRLNFLPVSHDPDIEESCLLLRKHLVLIKAHRRLRLCKIFLICSRAILNFCDFKDRICRNLCLCTICERDSIITAPYSKGAASGYSAFLRCLRLFRRSLRPAVCRISLCTGALSILCLAFRGF